MSSNTQIKAVLFDFGGVFTDSPFHAVHAYGEELGLDSTQVTQIVFGSYENDGDHPWHRLERGETTLEAARNDILELGQAHSTQIDIYDLFARMAGNNAGAGARQILVDRVRGLRTEGYTTGIITNNVVEFGEGWRSLLPVDELFEFVIDSSAVGVRKPDPAIFALALERLPGVAPQQALFLDDYQANVDAARACGLQSMLVEDDLAATIADMDALLQR